MELRAATEQDFEAIVGLVPTREELFFVYPKGEHPFSVEQVRALARSREALTVALEDAVVIGFANLYDVQPGCSAFIGNVVVARAWRGQGVGRRLVRHMVALARDEYGAREVRISVFNTNTPALLLYADAGFRPYALERRTDPAAARVGLIHMKLALPGR